MDAGAEVKPNPVPLGSLAVHEFVLFFDKVLCLGDLFLQGGLLQAA